MPSTQSGDRSLNKIYNQVSGIIIIIIIVVVIVLIIITVTEMFSDGSPDWVEGMSMNI